MKWTRNFLEDGSDAGMGWIEREAPMGYLTVCHNAHISDGEGRHYLVAWVVGPYGDDVRIGFAASEKAGKRMATNFILKVGACFRYRGGEK